MKASDICVTQASIYAVGGLCANKEELGLLMSVAAMVFAVLFIITISTESKTK